MLKKIRELFKIFKGVRSMIIIRCDNCGSINTELWKETLKNENIEINKKEYKKILLTVILFAALFLVAIMISIKEQTCKLFKCVKMIVKNK